MKKRTRIFVVLGIVVGLPIVAALTVPLLFGDRIANRAKAEVNSAVNARVNWRDAGLALFTRILASRHGRAGRTDLGIVGGLDGARLAAGARRSDPDEAAAARGQLATTEAITAVGRERLAALDTALGLSFARLGAARIRQTIGRARTTQAGPR